jgi:hypothetical protein
MPREEVVNALGDLSSISGPSVGIRGEGGYWAEFYETAVTVYYGESGKLSCVAIDALMGPQVVLDGIRLVGRVPSELSNEFNAYVMAHGMTVYYSQQGDPGADEYGIALRVQRAGDVVLTRPVMVAKEWSDRVGDASEGYIPQREWAEH